MLEIKYKTDTGIITAWASSPEHEGGHFEPEVGEEVAVLDIPTPEKSCDAYLFDGTALIDNPDYVGNRPPDSTHISKLVSIEVGVKRPAKVKRVWKGNDYFYNCFVTENIKDQYLAGDIIVGDYLLVHYDSIGEQIVTAKVFKSW